MNSKIPTCTAIILSYCDRDVFEKIDVALRQSHQFNNIIIVDDGSTHDLTDELIHYVKNIEKISLILHGSNKGIVSAMRTGIESVRTDYFYMMSCGDIYSDSILQDYFYVDWPKGYPGVIASGINTVDDQKSIYKEYTLSSKTNYLYKKDELLTLLKSTRPIFFGGGCIVMSKAGLKSINYLENLEWAADFFIYYFAAFYKGALFLDSIKMTNLVHADRLSAPTNFRKIIDVNYAFLESVEAVGDEFYQYCLKGSILPAYSLQILFSLAISKKFRGYVRLNLVYLCLTHSVAKKINLLFSHNLKQKLRKLMRI